MYNINKKILEKLKTNQNILLFDLESTGLIDPVEITQIGYIVLNSTYNEVNNTITLSVVSEGSKYFLPNKEVEPNAVLVTNIVRKKDMNSSYKKRIEEAAKDMHKKFDFSKFHQLEDEEEFNISYFNNLIENYNIGLFAGHNVYEYDFFKVLCNTYGYSIEAESVFDTLYYLIHSKRYKVTRGQNLNKLVKEIEKKSKNEELSNMLNTRDEYHDALIDVKVNKFLLENQIMELSLNDFEDNIVVDNSDLDTFNKGDIIYARTEVSGDSILTLKQLVNKTEELGSDRLIIVDNTFTGTIKYSNKLVDSGIQVIFGIQVTNIEEDKKYDILFKNTLEYRKALPLLKEQNIVTNKTLEDLKKYTNNLILDSQNVPLYVEKNDNIIHWIHLKYKQNEAFTKQELNGFFESCDEDLSINSGRLKHGHINDMLKETITKDNGWDTVDFKFYKSLGLSSFPALPVLYSGENGEITKEPETLEDFLNILRDLVYLEFDKRDLRKSISISYNGIQGKDLDSKVNIYFDRIEEELAVLKSLGNPDYVKYFFLVKKIGEFVKFGPGRGSGAGSILLWILGVTDTDPIPYGLLFERFMDPERADFPDVDLDIASKSYAFNVLSDYFNKEVPKYIDYTKSPYDIYDQYIINNYIKGTHIFVGKISTVSKSSNLTVANNFVRLNGFPEGMKKAVSREFDEKKTILENFKDCSESDMFFEKYPISTKNNSAYMQDKSNRYNTLLNKLNNIVDLTTNYGLHAGGVIFFPHHAQIIAPIHQENAICFDKDDTESMHMIKMDLLGLKTHAVLQEMQNHILKGDNPEDVFKLNFQSFNDPKVFLGLSLKYTAETFQMGSAGMDNILESLSPLVFADVISTTALYRPGPLGSGAVDDYICSAQQEKFKKYNIQSIIEGIKKREDNFNLFQTLVYKQQQIIKDFKSKIISFNELLILINDFKKHNKDENGKSLDLTEEYSESLLQHNIDISNLFLDYQKITGTINDISIYQRDNSYGKMTDDDGETFYVSKLITELIGTALIKSRYKFSIPKELKDDIKSLNHFYLIDDPILNENTIYDNAIEGNEEDYEYFEMFLDQLQKHGIKKEKGKLNKNLLRKSRMAFEQFIIDKRDNDFKSEYINSIDVTILNDKIIEDTSNLIKANIFEYCKKEMIKNMSVDFDSSLITNQVVENLLQPTIFYKDDKFTQPLIHFFNAWEHISKQLRDTDLYKKLLDSSLLKTDFSDEELNELNELFEKHKSSFSKVYIEIIEENNISTPDDFIKKIIEFELVIKENKRYSELTAETYGVMVYQEQIMKLSVQTAGYTKADSNQLRKAIAKQKKEQMIIHSNKFIKGISSKQISKIEFGGEYSHLECYKTIESEIDIVNKNDNTTTHVIATIEPNGDIRALNACEPEHRELIEKLNTVKETSTIHYSEPCLTFLQGKYLWNKIEAFGAYAFNKSHSASYTILTYLTQYYKEHYTMEAYTFFLRHVSEKNKMDLVREIHRRGIKFELQKIDSNISIDFTFKDNTIFVPLTFIKSLGFKEISSIMAYFSEFDIKTIEEYIVLTGLKPKKKILEVLGTLGIFNFETNGTPFCNITQRSWNNLHPLDLNKKSILIDYVYKEGIKSEEFKLLYKEDMKQLPNNSYSRVVFEPKYFELLNNLHFFQKRLSTESELTLDSKMLYLNEDLMDLEKTFIQTLLEDLIKTKPTIEEEDVKFLLKEIPIFKDVIIDTINTNSKVEEDKKNYYIDLFTSSINTSKIQRDYTFFKKTEEYKSFKDTFNSISKKTSPILRRMNNRLVENIDINNFSKDPSIIDNEEVINLLTKALEQKVKYNKLTIPYINKLRLLFKDMQAHSKETEELKSIYNKYKLHITPLVSKNGLFDKVYFEKEDIENTLFELDKLNDIFLNLIETSNKSFQTITKTKTLQTSTIKLIDFIKKIHPISKENILNLLNIEDFEDVLDKDEMSIVYDVFLKEGASIFTIKNEKLSDLKSVKYINSLDILKRHLDNNYSKEFDIVLSCVNVIKTVRDEEEAHSQINTLLDDNIGDSFIHSFETNKEFYIKNTINNSLFNYDKHPELLKYLPKTLSTDLKSNIIKNKLCPRHGNSSIFNFVILTEYFTDNKTLDSYIADVFENIPEEDKQDFLPLYISNSILSKKEKEKLERWLSPEQVKLFEDISQKIIMDTLFDIVNNEELSRILISVSSLKSPLRKQFLMKTYKFVEPSFGETSILPIVNSKKKVKKLECSFVKWFPWSFLEEPYQDSKQSFVDAIYEKNKIQIRKNLN